MKSRIQVLSLLGVAVAVLGCGGASSTLTPSTVLGKESARAAVKEAAGSVQDVQSSSSGMSAQGASTLKKQSREPIDGGEDGIWYKTTKEEYSFANGNQYRSALEVDMFDDAAHTNKVGYQTNYLRYEDVTGINETDYHFTSGKNAPRRIKSKSSLNPITGALMLENTEIDKDEQGRQYERVTKFNQSASEAGLSFEVNFSVGGSRYIFTGAIEPGGTFESKWNNSLGYEITWRTNPDGSGSIKVENSKNPLCPANGVFGADGKGTLTYADGSQEAFDINAQNFWQ